MSKAIIAEQPQSVPLIGWDQTGDTWVKIRKARAGENNARDDHFARMAVETDGIAIRQIQDWSMSELAIKECYLTFAGANLEYKDTEDGEGRPLFVEGMAYDAFRIGFALLPDIVADEWHANVLKINPHWRRINGAAERLRR